MSYFWNISHELRDTLYSFWFSDTTLVSFGFHVYTGSTLSAFTNDLFQVYKTLRVNLTL